MKTKVNRGKTPEEDVSLTSALLTEEEKEVTNLSSPRRTSGGPSGKSLHTNGQHTGKSSASQGAGKGRITTTNSQK